MPGPCLTHQALSGPMTSKIKQSSCLDSCPTFPSLNPHYNRPLGHWPYVKSCLVGGSNKYHPQAESSVCTGRRWTGTHFGRPRFVSLRIWSGVFWLGWQSVEVRFDCHPRAFGSRPPGSESSLKGLVLSPGAWGSPF